MYNILKHNFYSKESKYFIETSVNKMRYRKQQRLGLQADCCNFDDDLA